jgi:predicted CXXCH cytochrome family protein
MSRVAARARLLLAVGFISTVVGGVAGADANGPGHVPVVVFSQSGSVQAGLDLHLLEPSQVASVNCAACHALPSALASGEDVLQSTREVCLSCHAQQKQQLALPGAHPPFKGGECTACHRAHPGPEPQPDAIGLLKSETSDLCVSCHADARAQQDMPFAHIPFRSGQCTACHDPHATQRTFMLEEEGANLCFTCHRGAAQDLAAANQHPPFRAGSCLSCHSPHATSEPALLVASTQRVCLSCHAGAMARNESSHKPVREGWCTSCHQPHGSNNAPLLKAGDGQLCLMCHRM